MCICFIHCADNKNDEFVTEDQIIYNGSREILVNMLQESVSLNFIANGNWSLQIDYEQDYDWIEVSQSSGGAGKITTLFLVSSLFLARCCKASMCKKE